MIQRLSAQPACFSHINNAEYFGLSFDLQPNRAFGFCAVQIHGQIASIHLIFNRWTLSTFKQSLEDWGLLVSQLKNRGITQVVVSQDNLEDEKWERFIKHFGFDAVQTVKMAMREI